MHDSRRMMRISISMLATVGIAIGAAACGGDDSEFSEQAQRGRQIANSSGCASCHGTDGQGGIGPTWQGLAGSEFALEDGSTVVADQEYLVRSILDPAAEIVPGFSVRMAENGLTEQQALDIVAYINELKPVD